MKTAILIMRPDEAHAMREVELPDDLGYRDLAALIEPIVGRPMEHVSVLADWSGGIDYRPADMFVYELGHVDDPPLERNGAATLIYRRNPLLQEPETDPEELPWIAGPAVLFRDVVWK